MTTTEKNKLIAEFMKLEPTFILGRWQWSDMPYFSCSYTDKEKAVEAIAEYVKYYSSWDWLIPVIYKITRLGIDWDDNGNKLFDQMKDSLLTLQIDTTYQSVVNVIQWYNQQNK